MHKTTMFSTVLCSSLLLTAGSAMLAVAADAGKTGSVPAINAQATAPKPSNAETKAMQDAMQAYSAGHYEQAFIITEPLASMNHADAQYLLGKMYELGQGVEQDVEKAITLFTNAASQGLADAQARLGELLKKRSDHKGALDWFHKAAAQGHALAAKSIGDAYYNGYGVSKSVTTAIKFYKQAAIAGDADACLVLGTLYEKGTGVKASPKEALFWYGKGADLDNTACKTALDRLNAQGKHPA